MNWEVGLPRRSSRHPQTSLQTPGFAGGYAATVFTRHFVASEDWRRGESNPCPHCLPRKHLHVYPALCSEEPTLHRRTAVSRASAKSILRIRRGRSADSPACCPRFRRQQASLRKRHGQLSRESEIFVICVYLFWSGFLRGQRTILDMPPALSTMSRNQCAPVDQDTVRSCPAQIADEKSSIESLVCSNLLSLPIVG
jgi:hypothetical protein